MFKERELSIHKIKKYFIISQKKAFLTFPEMEPCTFHFKLEKKILPEKITYTLIFSKIS